MHRLVKTGQVNTMEENGKRFVVLDDKFHALTLKQRLTVVTKEERIEHLENEIALLKECQRNIQSELEHIKSQIKRGKGEPHKKMGAKNQAPAEVTTKEIVNETEKQKKEPSHEIGNPIIHGQLILGFKVISKIVRGIKQYQAYKWVAGKQCYVYLCPEVKPITFVQAEEKIRQYCEKHKVL
jgi:hypothetical protein